VKVQAESFHLDGHIIGFRPQTQKLESPYKTPSSTLAVKGLNEGSNFDMDRFLHEPLVISEVKINLLIMK